jgi:hypothetical protein
LATVTSDAKKRTASAIFIRALLRLRSHQRDCGAVLRQLREKPDCPTNIVTSLAPQKTDTLVRPAMTPEEQAKIERDRRRREALLLALLLLFGRQAMIHARAAIRVGADPVAAAADAIMGRGNAPAHVQHHGLATRATPLLQDAFAAGFATGIAQGGGTDGIAVLPTGATQYVFDYAATLQRKTAEAVRRVTGEALDNAHAAGLGTVATMGAVSDAFKTNGLHVDNPTGFEAAAERAVVTVRGSGQWGGWHVPNLLKMITGFRHHTIEDGRETEICHERAGLTLPVDDPYWLSNVPALHWGCRSLLGPVFGEQRWTVAYPVSIAAPGFGIAPVLFFGLPIGRAA